MQKQVQSNLFIILLLGAIFMAPEVVAQEVKDNPNLDQIPQWYLNQTQKQQRMPSEVITIDDFDNFYLGVDFAEGHIAGNPMDPKQFFTAFNTDGPHYTNNGFNWFDSNPSWGSSMRGDPVVAFDGDGKLYYENMYGSSIQGCKVVVSDNNGQTWDPAVIAISGNDKNWIAADQSNGPYANYVYTVMTNSPGGNFARSTDQGQTWQNTFSPSTQSLPGMMDCVGPDGTTQGGSVYVVTNSGSSFASTYTFYESNDGGQTFQTKSSQNFSGYVGSNVNGRNSVQNMRTRPYPFITADNSYGPNRGRLYLVYASNDPPGDGNKSDIWSRYSDDGGSTWSDAVRVNSGFNPQASHQWHPATWCDYETGRLYVQWMDTRDTPTNDSALIYATYSDDGGVTFKANKKISNEKMKINCSSCGGGGSPRYQGDYNGIASNSATSMSAWSDFRWGSFASFTAYFPDFAMRVYPTETDIQIKDTIWGVVPAVKLYNDEAIFSATIETPSSGSFTIEYPEGNSIIFNFSADSIPIVITADEVPLGEYLMTITAEGPNGTPVHQREAIINVVPIQPPTAEFSSNKTTVCKNAEVMFMDQSINATGWLWTFESGDPATSTEQNPTVSYSELGDFDVTLEVTNPAGSNTINKTDYITVQEIPEPPLAENEGACVGSEIPPLYAEGDNVSWYSDPELTQLEFSGNTFYTGQTMVGEYTYYATQTNLICNSEATIVTLSIYELPNVTFSPLDTICLSAESFVLDEGEPYGGYYYGPGVEDSLFNPQNAGVGTHTIAYVYADANSCSDTAYQEITILPLDNVSFSPLASVCLNNDSFELSGGEPSGGTYSGTGVTDNMFYPMDAGAGEHNITYTIIGQNGCPSNASQVINVWELPQVNLGMDTTICGDQTLTLNATTPNAASYLWSPGGTTSPTLVVDSTGIGYGTGEFGVIVTDNNSCSNGDEVAITFINCTGIRDIEGLQSIMLFPNPNEGTFNIDVNSDKYVVVNIEIFDVKGSKKFELENVEISGNFSQTITLKNAQPGFYFIKLENKTGIFVKKFLVK